MFYVVFIDILCECGHREPANVNCVSIPDMSFQKSFKVQCSISQIPNSDSSVTKNEVLEMLNAKLSVI